MQRIASLSQLRECCTLVLPMCNVVQRAVLNQCICIMRRHKVVVQPANQTSRNRELSTMEKLQSPCVDITASTCK